MLDHHSIDRALQAVGELLAAGDQRFSVVVIGGAALNLLGIVDRTTRDVDIVAFTLIPGERAVLTRPPEPLPDALARAIARVARDFNLPDNWMNRGPAGQWDVGLPPGFAERVQWRRYANLDVGLCARIDLIFFKLEAAADQPNSNSRHYHDLLALRPSADELQRAADWVRSQNAGPDFHAILDRVIAYVSRSRH